MGLDEFARQHLFAPLGIERFRWARSPGDRVKGQGNLSLRARDFLRIGELFLALGRVGVDPVLSAEWVKASFAPHVAIANVDPYADSYGYMWYAKTHALGERELRVHFASGNGGNKIYVVPSLGLVVTVMSSAYGRPYGQRRSQDILLRVLASVRA